MKAVIIAAGEGKRLRPITSTHPKPLIPIAGKPLLEHTILSLKSAGITEILLIVGYKEDLIKEYFGDGKEKFDITIQYTTQEEQLGTAHAFGYAKNFVKDEPVLFMYGDLLIEPKLYQDIVKEFHKNTASGIILLMEVENPEVFGIISLDSNGFVENIIEKPSPDLHVGNLANAGVFIFDSTIFQAIEKTNKSPRGEYEFTDAMEIFIKKLNSNIKGYTIKNRFWSDVGLPWQLLEANKFMLGQMEHNIYGRKQDDVDIIGKVSIGKNTEVKSGSQIEGPCYIGDNCIIGPKTSIKPYTSIGDNCIINKSEVENSLIFSNTKMIDSNYIGDSIICENVNFGAGSKTSNSNSDNTNVFVSIKGEQVNSGRRKLGAIIGANVQIGTNTNIMCGKKIGFNSKIGDNTLIRKDIPPDTLYNNK